MMIDCLEMKMKEEDAKEDGGGAAENSETFKTCLRSWGRGERKMNYL